ncbi:cytochrome b5 domain-containing protein 1 [Episyrphus balteatus]|uniref:cytochrome b5 domain-containing protein 1 n=1 Tax=Episyrphus balteatus TaxID=286459 RepID=UPI0024860751|nr:cytochrome b5 domain-containing protein 1 [Episyrphus balteatus]
MIKYFIYDEVVIHDKIDNFWVIIHGDVIDLTPLLQDRIESWNLNLEYILGFGGKDLSSYFYKDGTPRMETSAKTGRKRVLFPPIVEVTTSEMLRTEGKIWSQDPKYKIGKLTKQERQIRIINTLTGTTQLMKVCEEDKIYDILVKYKKFYNFHASSYVWRMKPINGSKCGRRLFFKKTLTENGLFKEKHGIPPSIWLYYSDDLTIA